MSNRTARSVLQARFVLRHRAHMAARGRLWSALGVALAAAGCAPPGPRAHESATDPLRHRVEIGAQAGSGLSYLRAGDATGPRVILVHGTPGSATAWADYLMEPPPGLEVLAPDRPGFGQSDPDSAVPGLAEQAAAVLALMPSDGRPVVLLGHSLGGPVVARAAAEHPARVTAVVLLSASLDPTLERIHMMQYLGAWSPVSRLLPRALRNANAELMALETELQALATMLPLIRAKVVIVHGTRDDLVPVANVPYMQSRLTGARCVHTTLLEGRNHFLPWNSEDAVRDAIRMALEPAC